MWNIPILKYKKALSYNNCCYCVIFRQKKAQNYINSELFYFTILIDFYRIFKEKVASTSVSPPASDNPVLGLEGS